MIEQFETKMSALRNELDEVKETLSRAQLDRDVCAQERAVLAEALRRAETQRGELELDVSQLRSDEAKLRDVLVKMQSLNDGLAQHKWELRKIVQQQEAEKSTMASEKTELEVVKASLKAELVKVEQEKHDIENERESMFYFIYQKRFLFRCSITIYT